MKLIITLLHDEGEDKDKGLTIAGTASTVLQYPKQGHIVVDPAQVTINAPKKTTERDSSHSR